MIVSFRDGRPAEFAGGKRVRTLVAIEQAALLKLDRLQAAAKIRDLAALPGNRLGALRGDRKGQDSIRINDRWRICLEWPDRSRGTENVEIGDYH